MNLQIRDKFPLIELSTTGSKARRYVKPEVMISGANNTPFKLGDMLDARGTYKLVNEMLYENSKPGVDSYTTLEAFNKALEAGKIKFGVVYFILDENIIYINGTYYRTEESYQDLIEQIVNNLNTEIDRSTQIDQALQEEIQGIKSSTKSVILTQEEYDSLEQIDPTITYYILS